MRSIKDRKRMAAFVLGRACRARGAETLTQILNDESEDPFLRIRAAGFLLCPGAQYAPKAEQFLYKKVIGIPVADGDESRTQQAQKIAASYYLFQIAKKQNDRCILDHLISGLKSPRSGVPQEIERILTNFFWKWSELETDGWSIDHWDKWWEDNSGQFRDCHAILTD